MKLNPDCVRDVLIYLEDNLSYTHERPDSIEHNKITMSKISEDLHKQFGYEIDDVNYSVEKLLEIGYIISQSKLTGHNQSILYCPISDISWSGHQFLNTIRSKTVWDATKKGASKLGIMSIHALSTIAMKIVETIVTDPNIIAKISEFL